MNAPRVDADELRRTVAVSDVVGRFVELKREGAELVGLCPFHEEKTPSFKVNDGKGVWSCFGCQKSGGVFDFVMRREGIDFRKAVDVVAQLAGVSPGEPVLRPTAAAREAARVKKEREQKTGTVVMPIPPDAPPVDFKHSRFKSEPVKVWTYRNAEGQIIGYVARFNFTKPDGSAGKEFVPRHYTTKGWRWTSSPVPRPLYGLEELAKRPTATVLVTEGEKACDAARLLFPDFVVVTWPGGAGAADKADWKPLDGRKVVIWPDADAPGRKASLVIAEALK